MRVRKIDAVVSEADGRARDRLPSGSPGEDPQGRDTQTEARSAGRAIAAEIAGRKSLSLDLDTFDRATRFAHVVAAPSPVGTNADASAEHAASHGAQSRSAAGPVPVEPTRPTRHRVAAPTAACRPSTERVAGFVSQTGGQGQQAGRTGHRPGFPASGCKAVTDPPGSRAHHGAGDRCNAFSGEEFLL